MVFTVEGAADCAEICKAITEYYQKGPLTKYTLWDYTKVSERINYIPENTETKPKEPEIKYSVQNKTLSRS